MLSNPQVGQIVFAVENNRNNWFKQVKKDTLIYRGVIDKVSIDGKYPNSLDGLHHKSNVNKGDLYTTPETEASIFEKLSKILLENATTTERIGVLIIIADNKNERHLTSFTFANTELLFETKEEAEQYLKEQLELLKQNVG